MQTGNLITSDFVVPKDPKGDYCPINLVCTNDIRYFEILDPPTKGNYCILFVQNDGTRKAWYFEDESEAKLILRVLYHRLDKAHLIPRLESIPFSEFPQPNRSSGLGSLFLEISTKI